MDMLRAHLVEALATLLPLVVGAVAAWLRARTRRLVVEQAALESELAASRGELDPDARKHRSRRLAQERLGPWTRPPGKELDRMLDKAHSTVRESLPAGVTPVPRSDKEHDV